MLGRETEGKKKKGSEQKTEGRMQKCGKRRPMHEDEDEVAKRKRVQRHVTCTFKRMTYVPCLAAKANVTKHQQGFALILFFFVETTDASVFDSWFTKVSLAVRYIKLWYIN